MTTLLLRMLVGAGCFVVLDGLWLGLLMSRFYRQHLSPIARLTPDGGFAVNWTAALLVYASLGAGLAVFVAPRASSLGSAAAYGALFGLLTYAVYDFTNLATLKHYPVPLALVDVAWGAVASGVAAMAIWALAR